jgi:hypothetical protein
MRRRRQPPAGALVPEYPLRLRARWGWGEPSLGTVRDWLAERDASFAPEVEAACALVEWARDVPRTESGPGEPCWENDYWGTFDALYQCAVLRRRDPALYLEVGSGWSTLFARRAISDFGLRTRIVSIDPSPRADVDAVCDEVIRVPMEEVDPAVFDQLGAGDVAFVDGSHTALMNSDATVFFLEILPRLAPGVLVGIDDIFLPDDYPESWTERVYGEQYLLAAFLLGGAAGWSVRFPAWWLTTGSAHAERFEAGWPVVENRFGRNAGSFWLERDA